MTCYSQLLQFAELFNYVEDMLAWAKDRHGRFVWVNRATVVMQAAKNGSEKLADAYQHILGKTDHDFVPDVLADQYELDDDYVLAGNRLVNRVETFRKPDGTACWHVTTKIPLYGDDGSVVGTAGVARPFKSSDLQAETSGGEFGAVLAHMRERYHQPITNRTLAKLAHMSVRAFERKFQRSFNLSPQKYLREMRVRVASHALAHTGQALSEVALNCGFADQSHFTREFRRHFGQTPREYRARISTVNLAAARSPKAAGSDQEADRHILHHLQWNEAGIGGN